MHSAVFSKDGATFVEYSDNLEQPPAVTVTRRDGQESFSLHKPATNLELDPPELHQFRASDGTTLYAALYRPAKMAGKAPVIVEVYGGPGPQTVVDSWAETVDLRAQMLRQHGFIVLKVDNRGSARRGLPFEAAIARNFGDVEVQDQVAGLHWLDSLGIADLSRVGIYGWSYGGYMTIMAMLREPDMFKVGVAGAPVTSWDGYDTAYTEKYMAKPDENHDGYRKSSALELAGRLKGKLLLIHGLIDENVHFRHTGRLMQAFTEANRPYDVLLYPNERHMPRSEKDRVAMESRILEYFENNL